MLTATARVGAVLALVGVLSGCATSALYRTAVVSDQLSASVSRLQDDVIRLHEAKVISDGDFRAWQRAFAQIATSGLALNAGIRAGHGASVRGQVEALLGVVDTLLREDVVRVPADHQATLQILLESVRATLVTLSVAVEE